MKVKSTLRHRFLISLVIYTALILALWFAYHSITHQAISRSELENTVLAADSLTSQIGAELFMMSTIARVIAESEYTMSFLAETDSTAYYEKAAVVSEIIKRTAFFITSTDNIVTINADGRIFRFSGSLSNHSLAALFAQAPAAISAQTIVSLDDTLYFCQITPVIDYHGRELGKVIILTGLDKTRRMLGSGDGIERLIVQDGIVLLSSDPALEGHDAAGLAAAYGMLSSTPVAGTSLTATAAIPGAALFPERTLFYAIAFISLCLLLVMVVILYRYQLSHIIRPMSDIIGHVREIGGGKEGRLPAVGRRDFDTLVGDINDMLDRTEAYNQAMAAQQKALFDAEIAQKNMRTNLLVSQMDAHFVVNTLKNLKRLSERGETDKAAQMAEGLAAILSHQHTGEALVNVFDDFHILRLYLDIMRIRFGQAVHVEYDVEDALEACLMPGLILQPIVENALTHGLQARLTENTADEGAAARLSIKGFMRERSICFEIADNGVGMEAAKLKSIQDSLLPGAAGDSPEPGLRGIALANIERRIRLICGEGYGLSIDSKPGEGTVVTVSLPVVADTSPASIYLNQ